MGNSPEQEPDDIEDEIRKHDVAFLKKHCNELMKHFDSVQIFVTRLDTVSRGTVACDWGEGNWYSRYGHINYWLNYQNKRAGDGDSDDDDDEE